jgi:uncharacterized protein (DUF427 family)
MRYDIRTGEKRDYQFTIYIMKAIWNGEVIAESDKTIEIEETQYFPPSSLKKEYFSRGYLRTMCPWKGDANYYTIEVKGERNENAAWYYPVPKFAAIEKVGKDFRNYVAFWNGVDVTQ